jgi:hypothetical protein
MAVLLIETGLEIYFKAFWYCNECAW